MALWLAEKVGPARNLMAVSVHPGYMNTNISSHIDWDEEWPIRRKLYHGFDSLYLIYLTCS